MFTPHDFLVGLIDFAKLYDFVGWCKNSQSRTILVYCKIFLVGCSFVESYDFLVSQNRMTMCGAIIVYITGFLIGLFFLQNPMTL